MMRIKIKQSEIDKSIKYCRMKMDDEIEYMINVVEGIVQELKQFGWCEGYRNDMAVDFTICCYYLGLDGKDIFEQMYNDPDFGRVIWVDTQDFNERYDTIMYYCENRWSNPYNKDIDMNKWFYEGKDIDPSDRVCVIVDDSEEAVTE